MPPETHALCTSWCGRIWNDLDRVRHVVFASGQCTTSKLKVNFNKYYCSTYQRSKKTFSQRLECFNTSSKARFALMNAFVSLKSFSILDRYFRCTNHCQAEFHSWCWGQCICTHTHKRVLFIWLTSCTVHSYMICYHFSRWNVSKGYGESNSEFICDSKQIWTLIFANGFSNKSHFCPWFFDTCCRPAHFLQRTPQNSEVVILGFKQNATFKKPGFIYIY